MLLAALALLVAIPDQPHIAVFDVKAQAGVSEQFAHAVSEQVTLEVRRMNPDASVMGSDELTAYLAKIERFPAPGCQEARCLSEIGGVLGAERIVFGTLARTGADYTLTLQLVDVAQGTVVKKSAARISGGREEARLNSTETLVEELLMAQRPRLIHAGCKSADDCGTGFVCGASGRCEAAAHASASAP